MRNPLRLIYILILIFFLQPVLQAQFFNNGAIIKVCENAEMYIKGHVLNDTGYFRNEGTIVMINDFINNTVFESGADSYVKLEGDSQEVGGTELIPFWNLFICGTNHKFFTGATQVNDSLRMIHNKIVLLDSNLTLTHTGHIYHPSPSRHVVTVGEGFLVKKMMPLFTDYLFPVSDTMDTYKPVTINYVGNTDTFAVRAIRGIHPTTGADTTTVYTTYHIQESNPGGTNATLKLGWNTHDEQPAFNNSWALLWQNLGGVWHPMSGPPGGIINHPVTDWYYKAEGLSFYPPYGRFIVRSMPVPTITYKPTPAYVCEGENAYFSIDAISMLQISYQWQKNCGSGWSDLIDNNTYSGSTTNYLTVRNTTLAMDGCLFRCRVSNDAGYALSDAVELTVYPKPIADFYTSETQININNYVEFYDLSTNATYWLWDFGEGSYSTDQNPIHYFYVDGLYDITLIVTSAEGCKDTLTKINYLDVIGPEIFVPSLFTPNDDGMNDVLFVRGEQLENFEFRVYNQLGLLLFQTNNQKMGWTGRYGGVDQPQGNYVWIVAGETRRGRKVQKQGVVTLAR